jgi:hypothetical protein
MLFDNRGDQADMRAIFATVVLAFASSAHAENWKTAPIDAVGHVMDDGCTTADKQVIHNRTKFASEYWMAHLAPGHTKPGEKTILFVDSVIPVDVINRCALSVAKAPDEYPNVAFIYPPQPRRGLAD